MVLLIYGQNRVASMTERKWTDGRQQYRIIRGSDEAHD